MVRKAKVRSAELLTEGQMDAIVDVARQVTGLERREPARAEATVVVAVPVPSRPMVTFGEDSVLWRVDEENDRTDVAEAQGVIDSAKGAFVRVRAPKGTSDERVDAYVRAFELVGAAGVKVERARPDAVHVAPEQKAPHRTARQVVIAMVEEARTRDRDALRALVEEVLHAEGM